MRPSRAAPPPPPGRGRPVELSSEEAAPELRQVLAVLSEVEAAGAPGYRPSPAPARHRPAAPPVPSPVRRPAPARPVPPPPPAPGPGDGPRPEKQERSSKTPQQLAERRKLVCAELVATEERYLEQLEQIVSNYQLPMQEAGVLPEEADRAIFINVGVLSKLHFDFLRALRSKMGSGPDGEDLIGEAMLGITPMLTLYIEYINRFHDGGQLLRKMHDRRRKFRKTLERCSHSNMRGIAGLETLMVVPVQRVPRYVLLLREVLKFTPEGHVDRDACTRAFDEMEKVTSFINEKKREYEQLQRLAFVSQNLAGGNMGALRETAKNLGKPHDFRANHTILPHSCDWCKELVHISEYKCASCGYQAHPHCFKQVPESCSDRVIDRDTRPELIRNYRKILKVNTLMHKCNRMDRLGEYENTPFKGHTILLCNDCIVLLKREGEDDDEDGGERRISPRKGEDKFILIDLVKWTSSLVEGDNATLNANVAVDLFSVSNRRQNLLHTFKMASSVKKDEWVDAIRAAMEQWKQHVRKNEEHEKVVTKKLTGLRFNITGTVPVASAFEKPFTVYIIQMTNSAGTLTILKRYRQLLALHHHLEEVYGEEALPKFPGKKLVGNTDEKFLQKRSRKLAAYLQGIITLKNILQDSHVRQFLTTTVSAKNEDELLPSFTMRTAEGKEYAESILETIDDAAEDDDDDDAALSELMRPSDNDNDNNGSVDAINEENVAYLADRSSGTSVGGGVTLITPESEASAIAEPQTALALYEYDGSVPDSLKLQKGDVLQVLSRADGWWYCTNQYQESGWVPTDYLTSDA